MAAMTCHECRDELELWAGMAELPRELNEHLAGCHECRSVWAELERLAKSVAGSTAFDVTPDERAEIIRGVNRRTRSEQATVVTPMSWLRVAAVAASVIIVAGIGITGYRAQWFGGRTSLPDSTVVAQVDSQTEPGSDADNSFVLDEEDFSIFETAIDSTVSLDDADILENLSEEQIQYLESHLDVRGLI